MGACFWSAALNPGFECLVLCCLCKGFHVPTTGRSPSNTLYVPHWPERERDFRERDPSERERERPFTERERETLQRERESLQRERETLQRERERESPFRERERERPFRERESPFRERERWNSHQQLIEACAKPCTPLEFHQSLSKTLLTPRSKTIQHAASFLLERNFAVSLRYICTLSIDSSRGVGGDGGGRGGGRWAGGPRGCSEPIAVADVIVVDAPSSRGCTELSGVVVHVFAVLQPANPRQ